MDVPDRAGGYGIGSRRTARDGAGTPLHKGRGIMVRDVRITGQDERLICVSRCAVAVVSKK